MKKLFFLAAVATMTLASCMNDEFVGAENSPTVANTETDAINFAFNIPNMTRAGGLVGATAAEKLGGMFVVEGTKGSEQGPTIAEPTIPNSPSTTVVFDNYLVGYTANTAGKTESNTHNWEYVGLEDGITGHLSNTTWGNLHSTVTAQTVKYWDYSTEQYDFIAWSTGLREAVTDAAVANNKVKVTRINTGADLSSTVAGKGGFTMTVANAEDLLQCYYTDITTVLKANYGEPVTLTFKNMAAKVRIALYETVPGYSVQDVKFYSADDDTPVTPDDLGTGISTTATLFTTGSDKLPRSGDVFVYYPHIGTDHRGTTPATRTWDYNKASVIVTPDAGTAITTQAFGTFPNTNIGETLKTATYAGSAADAYYTPAFPNSDGKALTLRVDYTLVSTDGSTEEIHVYGAKAVVPATYTIWQPNYAYTYVFKISDNTNGWTSTTSTDPKGLYPITFDAVVANFTDVNAEQATVTTVATPSITTYQQGHDHANKDEYSKSQKAGKDQTNVKDLYVQVMDNSGATSSLVDNLDDSNSLLFAVSKTNASEAEVMDALQNRTNTYSATSPVGRNGITLTTNPNISNTETQIVNGVDDQPITKVGTTPIASGMVAKIDIDQLATGTYAYVYVTTAPTSDERVYHLAADATSDATVVKYYEVNPADLTATSDATAQAKKVYFVANLDAQNNIVNYSFKQTNVGDDVTGLYEATIDPDVATKATTYTSGHFYFDIYNRNKGKYAVKVIKVVS